MLLGLIGWVLPPSRMPAAGTSAQEPDSTWPLAQPSSCTFGGYLGQGRERWARQALLPSASPSSAGEAMTGPALGFGVPVSAICGQTKPIEPPRHVRRLRTLEGLGSCQETPLAGIR